MQKIFCSFILEHGIILKLWNVQNLLIYGTNRWLQLYMFLLFFYCSYKIHSFDITDYSFVG